MKPAHIALSTLLAAAMTLTGCIDQTKDVPNQIYIYSDDGSGGGTPDTPVSPYPQLPKQTLLSNITTDTTLTSNIAWVIDGLVTVTSGTTLTIEPGTILIGKDGTGINTSYMVVDKGAKIIANGTETAPIIFTSELEYDGTAVAAVGQWGGLTIIGNAANAQVAPYEVNTDFVPGMTDLADNSGVLNHVKILNSGITMDIDKEINGLSLVGVGSGTTIENISVIKSDDDCIEIWGGTVNLTNVTVRECTDDQFDVDDGYAGTVRNLSIHQTATNSGNAGIEMSGTTAATFDGFEITQDASSKEGGIYFKNGQGIGGHFKNGIVRDNVTDANGAIHSNDADVGTAAEISFENVTLTGTSTDPRFTGPADVAIETIFNAGTLTRAKEMTLPSIIDTDTTLASDTIWVIDGLVTVNGTGTALTIDPGTILVGKSGTGINTSYMVVDKGAQIIANGTGTAPIIFTSENAYVKGDAPAVGQWGGLTIIGNAANAQVAPYEVNTDFVPGTTNLADNSGVLNYVQILNSGITMDIDKEINGLSLVGVGSGTTIENISVIKSDDDCIEIWGGTVNLTNVTVRECTDDQFDVDDGYAGTVRNLSIHQTATNSGNAGIEMSGTTAATFDGFTIIQDASSKEGGIYFKNGQGIGGHFLNGIVMDNVVDDFGAIHSNDADVGTAAVISFESVTLTGIDSDDRFTGPAGDAIEAIFDAGTNNSK